MKTIKQNILLLIVVSASLLCQAETATPSPVATGSVEDRLSALEKNLNAVHQENAELRKQLGWDGKTPLVVLRPSGKESRLRIGGYIQGHYETGDSPDARFAAVEDRIFLRRARLGVMGVFKEYFDFKFDADFAANALGEQTGYRAAVTDAILNWNRFNFANVRVGQFKTPFGYEQLQSDTKILTVERSLANDRLTDNRQVGFGICSDLTNRFNYSLGVYNGSGPNNSFNDNDNFMWGGRVTAVAFDGKIADKDSRLCIGLNGLTTRDNAISKLGFGFAGNLFTGKRHSWGVDAQAKWGLFGLEGEYLRTEFKPLGGVAFTSDGWSAAVIAEVMPKRLQTFVKFETFDPNRSLFANTTDVWTLGLNYFVKGDDIKLSLNYLLGNAPGSPEHKSGRLLARVQIMY